MATLGNPGNTIEVLQKYNFNFQKKFGQNFLIDTHVLDKIIRESGVTKDDLVIEIGPGIGTMTQYLCENAREVVAIEIDKNLIPILQDTLSAYDNVTVINEDVMKVDLMEIVREYSDGMSVSVCANLPYYITTPILMRLLESGVAFNSITVMVQNEVAARLAAKPGSSDYGAITAVIGYYGEVRRLFKVSAGSFVPMPKVDSAVVRIDLYKESRFSPKNEKLFRALIKAAFEMRRKTLQNAISAKLGSFSKELINSAILSLGYPETVRGERLSTEDFVKLADYLSEYEK
jgi:16S rRNA (adenine1518-N6/adenine1519-N6)-dimethyltransferase